MLIGCLALPRLFKSFGNVFMHRAMNLNLNVSKDLPTFSERIRVFGLLSSSCSVPEHLF